MIKVKEVAFTGYPVTDFARARKFYGEALGLRESLVIEDAGTVHWVEYDIAGHTLALAQASPQWQPNAHGGGICLEVESLEDAVEHVKAHGSHVVVPISEFPVCRLAIITDPDGNTIALHQRKANHPLAT
jgi:predicted enzyme related to lactoylglutathione lyase